MAMHLAFTKVLSIVTLLGLAACESAPPSSLGPADDSRSEGHHTAPTDAPTSPSAQPADAPAPTAAPAPAAKAIVNRFPNVTPVATTYTSESGTHLSLNAWAGDKVAILTASPSLDAATMGVMLTVFDDVYAYYASATGRTPDIQLTYEGRLTIAEVPNGTTCGAGCSYIGATGIELMTDYFDVLYDGVRKNNVWDQVTFYEFGRNFWFYDGTIGYHAPDPSDAIVTGFAVAMRFTSMDAVGVAGAPFNDAPFATFRTNVEGLVDLYVDDPSQSWGNTLRIGEAPSNPTGLGATDLFASFILRLARVHGAAFVSKLWQTVGTRAPTSTTQQAVDNFVVSASIAASTDLGTLFATKWRWPVSSVARTAASHAGPAADLSRY